MALYKGSSPDPNAGSRFQGLLWSRQGPGSTLRVPTCPRERISPRFELFDTAARNADDRYATFSAVQQAPWETSAQQNPWQGWCPPWAGNQPYGDGGTLGVDCYRGTALSRLCQGLPATETPPLIATLAANDALTLAANDDGQPADYPPNIHICATWSRSATTGPGPHVALLWARPRQTLSSGVGQFTKYRFIGWQFITPNIPLLLDPTITRNPFVTPGGVISLQVAFAEHGRAPFAWCKAELRIKEEPDMQQGSGPCEARLTLLSGVPITATDIVSATTLFLTPFRGNRIALWDGYHWNSYPLTELQHTNASMGGGRNFDIFCEAQGCALALSHGQNWTTPNARAVPLQYYNGILCQKGTPALRYIGTIRTNAAGEFTDTARQRFVANWCSHAPRPLELLGAAYWIYSSQAWQLANAGNADGAGHSAVEFIVPGVLPETPVDVSLLAASETASALLNAAQAALSLDALLPHGTYIQATPGRADLLGTTGIIPAMPARYHGYPSIGYHALNWIEACIEANTTYWLGSAGGAHGGASNWQSGIQGSINA